MPPGRDACQEKRQELLAAVGRDPRQCQADSECAVLEPELTGRCAVSTLGSSAADDFSTMIHETCDAVPQMTLPCEPVKPACAAGRCVAARVDSQACTAATEPFVQALKAADDSCTADADCETRQIDDRIYAVRADALAKLNALDRRFKDLCQVNPAESPPTCEASRCTPHPVMSADIVRPVVDLSCLVSAMRPLARKYTGQVIVKATVNTRGQINYFRVLKGPDGWSGEVLWSVAHCPAKPATLNGVPISMRYAFNFNLSH